MDKKLNIYEEIAGHKGYKRVYTRISCVEEYILTYHKQISFDIHDDMPGYVLPSPDANCLPFLVKLVP
jgi:hypothetical protein